MSLSIYSIKHPLVLNWTSSIIYSNVSSRHKFQFLRSIGLALIYEATRKSISPTNLSIKNIDAYKSISILPQQLSHLILIDVYLYQVLSVDINALLPSTTIYPIHHINAYLKGTLLKRDKLLGEIFTKSASSELIILIKHLNSEYSSIVLNMLECNQLISNKIQICCVTCSTEALQLLNLQKANIDIYTAKILDH